MTGKYHLWHNGEFKTMKEWDDVVACKGAYVGSVSWVDSAVVYYGIVIEQGQWISANKADMPKELLAGMLLTGVL